MATHFDRVYWWVHVPLCHCLDLWLVMSFAPSFLWAAIVCVLCESIHAPGSGDCQCATLLTTTTAGVPKPPAWTWADHFFGVAVASAA